MKNKRLIMIIAQVGLVIAFTAGFYVFNQKSINPTVAWVYNRDIPVNTQITEGDLQGITIPASAVSDKFVMDKSEILGKYVNTNVFAGEYVVDSNVVELEETDPFESLDLTGLRKISIPTNYIDGLGGEIKRGDKVDLVYIGEGVKETQDKSSNFTYSKTFLQDILVYNVMTDDGQVYQGKTREESVDSSGEEIDTTSSNGDLGTIILAVTPDQAEQITARLSSGGVRIIGRFNESANKDTSGFIIGDYQQIFTGEGLAETNN